MSQQLNALFEPLEHWLATHAPELHAELKPGATEAELNELETLVGQSLPDSFRALYLRHADWDGAFRLTHLTLEDVRREWLVWEGLAHEDFAGESSEHRSHPPGAITPRYINLGWIPLLTDHGGNSVGIDLAPGPQGVRGQVITFGRDEREKFVLAASLQGFLEQYVERLEAGRVVVINELEGDFGAQQRLELTDDSGQGVDGYTWLADLFPGFGSES